MTDIPLLLVVAAIIGALLNVIRGIGKAPTGTKLDPWQIVGAFILAVMGSISAVSLLDTSSIGGPVGLFIVGLLAGFGTDFGITKLKNGGS